MSKNLIVKDNALINASYNLELLEQRLILLAIAQARRTNQELSATSQIKISISDYMNAYSVEGRSVYENIKKACKSLFERQFTYHETQKKGVRVATSRWVSEIAYNNETTTVDIIFAPSVVPLVTLLERHFTSYNLEQVAGLTSKYAIRLYEIIIAWRSQNKTPVISVGELRNRLGVMPDEYQKMEVLKRKVIDFSIKQINEKTDIKVSYKQHKNGRVITAFEFEFETKEKKKPKSTKSQSKADNERDKDTIDMFNGLTDKQADMFSKILSKLTVDGVARLDSLAGGLSEKEFATKLCDILKNPNNYDDKIVKRVFNNLNKHTDFNK